MADEQSSGIPLASETIVRVRLITGDPARSRPAVHAALAGLPSVKRVASGSSDAATFWLTTRSMAALLSEVTQSASLADAQVSWEPTEGLILRLPTDLDRSRQSAISWSMGDASSDPSSPDSPPSVQEAVLNWSRDDGWILRTASPPEPADDAASAVASAAETDLGPPASVERETEDSTPSPTAVAHQDVVASSRLEDRIESELPDTARVPSEPAATKQDASPPADESDTAAGLSLATPNVESNAVPSVDRSLPDDGAPGPAASGPPQAALDTPTPGRDQPVLAPVSAADEILQPTVADPVTNAPSSGAAVSTAGTVAELAVAHDADAPVLPGSGRKASLDRARADAGVPATGTDAASVPALPAVEATTVRPVRRRRSPSHTEDRTHRRRRWPIVAGLIVLLAGTLAGIGLLRGGDGRDGAAVSDSTDANSSSSSQAWSVGGPALAAGVLPVFGDVLGPGWRDFSWDAVVNPASNPVYAGAQSLAVAFTKGWGALALNIADAIDPTVYSHLRFALAPARSGQVLTLSLRDAANDTLGEPVPLAAYGGAPEANSWRLYTIPLADLGAAGRQVRGIVLQDASGAAQPPLHLDELAFVGPPIIAPAVASNRTATATPVNIPTPPLATPAAAAQTPTPTPSSTPTRAATVTATATPPATATATAVATASRTPTATATVAATATPLATPTARPPVTIARSYESVCRMRPDRRPCDTTGRALWNGEIGAWQLLATQNRQPLPDEERVLAETIRLRLEMGDPPTRIVYARRRGEAATFINSATFLPVAGVEPLSHLQIELENRGFATANLGNAEVVTEGGDVLVVLPPGATLAAGSRCRISTGPAAENPCSFSPLRADRLRGDRPVLLILRTAAGEPIDTLDLPTSP